MIFRHGMTPCPGAVRFAVDLPGPPRYDKGKRQKGEGKRQKEKGKGSFIVFTFYFLLFTFLK